MRTPREFRNSAERYDDFLAERKKIEELRSIVNNHQNGVVDGERVDLFTASAIIAIYNGLSEANQVKYAEMPVAKMANVAFKLLGGKK
jgi:hypothetical protein